VQRDAKTAQNNRENEKKWHEKEKERRIKTVGSWEL
jgi:hypothetical protein